MYFRFKLVSRQTVQSLIITFFRNAVYVCFLRWLTANNGHYHFANTYSAAVNVLLHPQVVLNTHKVESSAGTKFDATDREQK